MTGPREKIVDILLSRADPETVEALAAQLRDVLQQPHSMGTRVLALSKVLAEYIIASPIPTIVWAASTKYISQQVGVELAKEGTE